MHWGKTFWVFEQLRSQDPDIVAHYFQAKRRLAKPSALERYDANATVAVLSAAMRTRPVPVVPGTWVSTWIVPSRRSL